MWKNITRLNSSNQDVSKFLFEAEDALVEAVLYKYPTYADRTVICCSTECGCRVGCSFCGTGRNFVRTLTAEEIVSQVDYLIGETNTDPSIMGRLQIMFMSMGEPMHNYNQLKVALDMLYEKYPEAALLISTSAPKTKTAFRDLRVLSVKIPTIGLQFSVHESTNEARQNLIPTKTMTLEEISEEGFRWHQITGRKPFFNFCAHKGNTSDEDADRLLALFNPSVWECTISVICEKDETVRDATLRQRELASGFSSKMLQRGFNVRVFDPAGQDDIGGGCGQLWGTQRWMKEHKEKIACTV